MVAEEEYCRELLPQAVYSTIMWYRVPGQVCNINGEATQPLIPSVRYALESGDLVQ